MANDKTALGLEVPVQVINSYKELTKAAKAARDEQVVAAEKFGLASEEYKKASKNVAALKDKMDDLGDSSRSLKGSGIERSAQGFSQLGEGLRNLDLDKVKVGLTAIKSALAATGIMLLVQGVMYLIENFEELSKGTGILGTILRAVGKIVEELKGAFDDLTDSIGATNTALDKWADNIKKGVGEGKEVLEQFNAEMDNGIKLAKANGESTIKYEKAKQDAIIVTNKLIVEQMIALVRAGHELTEEEKKQITASINLIKTANVEKKVIDANYRAEVLKADKKAYDTKKTRWDQEMKDYKKQEDDKLEYSKQKAKELDDYIHELNVQARKKLEEKREEEKAFADEDLNASFDRVNKLNDYKKWSEEDYRNAINGTLAVAKISADSQAQLVNFLFDLKRSKGKKGSEEDLKLAKRQFQINKALAIQSSIISGIQGVINTLSAQSVIPEPYGTILKVATAASVGIAATVNTAKIARQQFNEGGSSGGDSSASTGNIGSAASAPPPTMNTTANTPPSTTQFDNNGKNQSIKLEAEVVETKVTGAQNRVNRLQEQATF